MFTFVYFNCNFFKWLLLFYYYYYYYYYYYQVDSYSAFFDNGQFRHTELNQKLKNAGIDTVFVTGLARDFCVYYTAKDAKMLGTCSLALNIDVS